MLELLLSSNVVACSVDQPLRCNEHSIPEMGPCACCAHLPLTSVQDSMVRNVPLC